MKAEQIDIHSDPDGYIYILQGEDYDAAGCVRITPEQAELVCQWIMEAKKTHDFHGEKKIGGA